MFHQQHGRSRRDGCAECEQPRGAETPGRRGCGLGEITHGRGEGRHAPEDVREKPAGIQPGRGGEARRRDPVDLVDDEEYDDARREVAVGDRAPGRRQGQEGERRQEQDVHRRIGQGNGVRDPVARTREQRVHDEDPLAGAECDCEERGIQDSAAPIEGTHAQH